jgi:hypothetical protein
VNAGNAVFIALSLGAVLLMYLRTERKRKWLTGVFLVLPSLVLLVLWADGTGQWAEALTGGAAGVGFNLLFWLFYGRANPPGTSDSINVIGMDD